MQPGKRVKFWLGLGLLLAVQPGLAWAETDSSLALWAQSNVTSPPSSSPAPAGPQPAVAAGLALFPGVVVHGAGHFYAGRPLTGSVLAAVEAAAVYLMIRGGTEAYASGKNVADAFSNSTGQGGSRNPGDTGNTSLGLGLAGAGLVIFLGSWFFDLSGAPLAARERQQEARTEPAVSARLNGRGVAVVVEGF